MKHLVFSLIALLLLTTAAFTQTIVSGRVLDSYTKEPLGGANIIVPNTAIGTTTDEKGLFILTTQQQIDRLQVSYVGYRTVIVSIGRETERLTILLESTELQLSEITVVGYESNRRLIETAGSINLLTADQIRRFDNSSILPALNLIPGVRMESQMPGGGSRLSIRGSLLRSPRGIRGIKAYWNEIPLTDAGGSTNFDLLEPTLIGHLEVLKGPAGSIYGAGTGGVMILTAARSPYGEPGVGLASQTGSFGLRRHSVSFGSGFQDANVRISFTDQRYRGYREAQSGTFRRVLGINSIFFPSENRMVSALLIHANTEFQLPGALTNAEYDANPRQVQSVIRQLGSRLTRQSTNVGLSHRYDLDKAFLNVTSLYTSVADLDHPTGTNVQNAAYVRSKYISFGGRTRFSYAPERFPFKTKLTFGGEFQRDLIAEKRYANQQGKPGPMRMDTDLTAQNYILFAQAEAEVTPEAILTVGASLNKTTHTVLDLYNPPGNPNESASVGFTPTLAPRIGLVYKLAPTVALHGSISRGFGPPTSSELVATVTGEEKTSLTPEQGVNYELGIRGTVLEERFNFDISSFLFNLESIIISRTTKSGTITYENSGSSNQRGVEASCSYLAINDGESTISLLKPFLHYTYHDFRFDKYVTRNEANPKQTHDFSGKRIPGISPHVLVFGLDVATNFGAYAYLTYSYYDKRYITNANDVNISAYRLASGKAGYRSRVFGVFELDAFAGVENALNEKYVSFLAINEAGGRYYHPAPPRSFYGGLSLKYVM